MSPNSRGGGKRTRGPQKALCTKAHKSAQKRTKAHKSAQMRTHVFWVSTEQGFRSKRLYLYPLSHALLNLERMGLSSLNFASRVSTLGAKTESALLTFAQSSLPCWQIPSRLWSRKYQRHQAGGVRGRREQQAMCVFLPRIVTVAGKTTAHTIFACGAKNDRKIAKSVRTKAHKSAQKRTLHTKFPKVRKRTKAHKSACALSPLSEPPP